MLRIAIWGLGSHARKSVIGSIAASNSAELHGVYSRDQSVRAECAVQAGCRPYRDEAEMLEDDDLDAIWIATPNGCHFEQSIKALEHTKHVLVEKTACESVGEAMELADRAKALNLTVIEGLMYLYHPQFKRLKEILVECRFGKLLELQAVFGFPHRPASDIRYQASLGGGALNDAGAYPVSALRALLQGEPTIEYSCIDDSVARSTDVSGVSEFVDAVGARGRASWRIGAAYTNEIRAWCEEGHVIAERVFSKPDTLETSIRVVANSKLIHEESIPPRNHFQAMLDAFVNSIGEDSADEARQELVLQATSMQRIRDGRHKLVD